MQFTILEPMSTGDVIDRAVRLYRRNFGPLIAIVAVPTLIGYVISLMFWYGYSNVVLNAATPGRMPADAVLLMIIGMAGYPVSGLILLLTVCGMARVVGDNLMMGEPITFRRCFAAVRGKVGQVILLGLLIMALLFGVYMALVVLVFVLALAIMLVGGLIASMHLPQWMIVLLMVIVILLSIAAALFAISFVVARIVFMPQVLMIEGESVGSALGRAFKLGKGNWHRVLAIMLFTYFITLSLMGAMTITTAAVLYLTGFLEGASLTNPLWNILYTSFNDIARMLSLPIWIVSFTLLYFDSRVRKEAYDIELLAREVAPGYVWHAPPVPPPVFAGYYPPREYIQTSPLGLGGYYPPPPTLAPPMQAPPAQPAPPVAVEPPPVAPGDEMRTRFEEAARSINQESQPGDDADEMNQPPPTPAPGAWCAACGNHLEPGSRFCNRCGAPQPGVNS
ncbi:MAG TPA: zinc ribbon domain-containing protein [Blastocatellia bacterium]|nr:zinc ribbon domain-containing protein [Blastocatellia bacterium]